jgi:hypothetical protein
MRKYTFPLKTGSENMKLYQLPRESKLKIYANGEKEMRWATFHHIDGMYSLCTLDDVPKDDAYFHLSASTPMKLVNDHYEIDETP